jgi:hypothetical protein
VIVQALAKLREAKPAGSPHQVAKPLPKRAHVPERDMPAHGLIEHVDLEPSKGSGKRNGNDLIHDLLLPFVTIAEAVSREAARLR